MSGMRDIFKANQEREAAVTDYATRPEVVAVVQSRVKARRGPGPEQTPDVKFTHGDHSTGFSVALRVVDGRVVFEPRRSPARLRILSAKGGAGSLRWYCGGCETQMPNVGVDLVLQRAVQSLIDTRRPFRVDVSTLT